MRDFAKPRGSSFLVHSQSAIGKMVRIVRETAIGKDRGNARSTMGGCAQGMSKLGLRSQSAIGQNNLRAIRRVASRPETIKDMTAI
jgi:hypothetical protein